MRWINAPAGMPWNNPWPHDMVISVEDRSLPLNELLFIRHAWDLAPDADIPALSPRPAPGASRTPGSASVAEWEERWQTAWKRAWDWYEMRERTAENRPTPEVIRQVTRPAQPLHPFIPPLWSSEYGRDGVDQAAFHAWHNSLVPAVPPTAERDSLQALIPAWESGLEEIIVLPYAGFYAKRISRRQLVVSAVTRRNPASYSRALAVRLAEGG
ncbi:hypothetical protein [Arthrobacter sp. AZCC_0090]|uniref:hypothetical protein n=1 Tax=Arthrobacter sp. AZCC_0090 TaxID=2735881 RepID=UPI001614D484|nr:hypothetical protein [Arthrobacter sp. AZCC_0090]MBB6406054.1 hypothetical protein [Arthrobacter sp. AZCC_0090]